jgi:hypothetical protein
MPVLRESTTFIGIPGREPAHAADVKPATSFVFAPPRNEVQADDEVLTGSLSTLVAFRKWLRG